VAASETASTLFWFAPILPGMSVLVAGQALFAMGRIRTIAGLWCAITVLTVALGWALLRSMGQQGVALAYSAATLSAAAGALVILARTAGLRMREIGLSAGRMGISAGLMAALVVGGRTLFERSGWGTGKIELAIEVGSLGLLGAAAYMVAMALLGAPEWTEVRRRL